jgi:hypothetical protein
MAAVILFHAALIRIGFNQVTATCMQTKNELTDITVLIDTDEESLHQLGKHMMAWRDTTVPPAN